MWRNPVSYNGWTFEWEAGRQLSKMTKTGLSLTFKHNDSGIRTEKTVNGVSTKYHLVGDRVTQETNGTDTIYYTYDSSDSLVSMNLNGIEYYYIRNAQGDIIGLFDKNGATVASYTYDSWGKLISIKDGSGTDITNNTASVGYKNPYRYRGYRYDTETNLYYLNSRCYNPEWGRFLNIDDISNNEVGTLLSHNLYTYCLNNPVNMVDPDGDIAVALGGLYFVPGLGQVLLAATVVVGGGIAAAYGGYKVGQYISESTKKKPINLPSFKKLKVDMPHILSGHTPNGNRNPKGKKDVFWGMSATAIKKAIEEAYNAGSKIQTQGNRVLLRGYSKTYKVVIEMWVNLKDKIIETAYPQY